MSDEAEKALKKANQQIKCLCGMVNSYANDLGIMPKGKNKVNAEDWVVKVRSTPKT